MPESLIPLVAIIEGGGDSTTSRRAIVGAPFLLATLAMFLVGLAAHGYREPPLAGSRVCHVPTLDRDLTVFLASSPLHWCWGRASAVRSPAPWRSSPVTHLRAEDARRWIEGGGP